MNWISVKDRLPEESDKVLVYNGNFIWIGYYRKDYDIQGENAVLLPRKWEYEKMNLDWEITHWMPFPEKPIEIELH